MAADDPIELLPQDAPLGLDDELADALGETTTDVADPEEDLPPIGRGWAFDFEKGQFIRHGKGPMVVRDLDNLRMWVEKTLRTAQGAHPIYTDGYGVEDPSEGIGAPFGAETVGRRTEQIKGALTVHDRITDVTDFKFTGSVASDELLVTFRVVADDEELVFNALSLGGASLG